MPNPETFKMIAHIKGLLIEKSPTEVVIEVNGIGYSINISLNTFSKLGNNENIKLFTYLRGYLCISRSSILTLFS